MSKILIGNILRCPENDELWMRTVIVNGTPMTAYARHKEELGEQHA
jgi:hypothetical protein